MNWYLDALKKYAVFDGRARRQEYWMFVLFNIIISIVLGILEAIVPVLRFLVILYGLALIVPSLAVAVRRLHDTNRSGWWVLISLIPIIGAILLLVWLVMDSQPGENKYGPNPKFGYPPPTGYQPPSGYPPAVGYQPPTGNQPPNPISYCPNCGAKTTSGEGFCANCGTKLDR